MQVYRGRQGEGNQHSPAPGQLAAGFDGQISKGSGITVLSS
jgi:hypothetical protein